MGKLFDLHANLIREAKAIRKPEEEDLMGKLFDLHANQIREAKRTKQPEPNNADLPMLWILVPTLSKLILAEYAATLTSLVPTGVYLLPPGCKTGIIVVHQLPKTPETLWFRLLGKEKVQLNAIAEVAALPLLAHPCRQDALSWLGNLKVILEAKAIRKPEEEDLMMQLSPLFLEKLQAAEQQGEVKGQQELVFRQLKRRVGSISVDLEARVKALPLAQLEELGEALLDFSSIADLETWLSQN
jgi:hypothetical protein